MSYENAVKVTGIVRDAGGRVVGRTRLQKIAYLLSVAGWENGLSFSYRHYGPYSEDVAVGAQNANLLGLLREVEQQASWGGFYSTYSVIGMSSDTNHDRSALAAAAAQADAVELELAATAVFLSHEGHSDPWGETARRKPEKATEDRMERAKLLYRNLLHVKTPRPLPNIL